MIVRSLPFKINTAIITTAVVISILFFISLYPLEANRRADQFKRINLLLDTIFKQKINDLANELFARQARALEATMKEVGEVDAIVGVSIYEETGKLFLSINNQLHNDQIEEKFRQIDKGPIFEKVRIGEQSLAMYTNTIEVIGKKIGYIAMYYDLAKIESESKKAVRIISLLLVSTVVLMAIILNLFLFRSVIRPVTELRSAMRRVEDGYLGETVTLPGKDEIGDMGLAFNDMSLKLWSGSTALIMAEKKYRSIFENAIEGIFQYAPDQGRFITMNSSMAAILGYHSPEELMTVITHIDKQFFSHEADYQTYDQTLQNTGRIIEFKAEFFSKSGRRIWASISARRVIDDGSGELHDEGSFVDITERRQRERAERQREAAESANQAKSEFLAKMSHEMRTPLNAILGFAEILENSLTDRVQREHLQLIKSSGSNLLFLIGDILDLSKIEAGRMDIKRSAVNLRALVGELLSLFSMNTKQKGIKLKTRIDPDLPEYLMLDRVRLRQILFNLMGNAVKFTDSGFVEIQVDVKKGQGKKLWDLRIAIHDSGPGIEAEAQELIFESFHQLPNDQSRSVEGTGLGLAISKNLVEMMNGQIVVESAPGKGSTFTVSLPEVAAIIQSEVDSLDPDSLDAVETAMVFLPACLLVVDDLAVNRQLVAAELKGAPFRILEADNGRTAVSMTTQHQPDLILMDIKMPGLDGYQALRQIRQQPHLNMPIIAITAAGMKDDIRRIQSAGFDDYLIRPFNRKQLQQKIAQFLKHEILSPYHAVETEIEVNHQTGAENAFSWDCPHDVAVQLRGRYSETWEMIRNKQRIPDIKQFSEDIRHLGEQYGLEVLTLYGQNLSVFANAFDIDKIQQSMAHFAELIEGMRETTDS